MEEKIFTVNLKKEFMKNARWKRSSRASREIRRFLERNMKSENVKIDSSINKAIWVSGDQKPPKKLKIRAVKDDDGKVTAELFGATVEQPTEKPEEKKEHKKEEKPKK
jgi:large subunit ribosomal protein L31e